jgi:hypothetical protein
MPPVAPPRNRVASVNLKTLAAGTELWRAHSSKRTSTDFNPRPSDPFEGGRFDGTLADPYPYLYAARDPETALLESFVRSVPFSDHGNRRIRRAAVAGRRLSALQTTRDLSLVCLLTHADLAAACQDEWLIQAEPRDYPFTRHWSSWLRTQAPAADGLIWPSRRDLGDHPVIMLFGDRGAPPLTLGARPPVDLDDCDGARWLNARLAPYRIRVAPPSPRRATSSLAAGTP